MNRFKDNSKVSAMLPLLCISACIAGASAGCFSESSINDIDKLYLSSLLHYYLSASPGFPVASIFADILTLAAIAACSFIPLGTPAVLVILCGRSFAAGFCGGLLAFSASRTGSAGLLFLFISVNILVTLILLAAAATSLSTNTGITAARHPGTAFRKFPVRRLSILLAAISVLSVLECIIMKII